MNRYLQHLQYNLTHEQIALVINNYFKFDTATGKLGESEGAVLFLHIYYRHHLENLSYQTHTKLWALKSSCKGTFFTKCLSKTIVVCSTLRVKVELYQNKKKFILNFDLDLAFDIDLMQLYNYNIIKNAQVNRKFCSFV